MQSVFPNNKSNNYSGDDPKFVESWYSWLGRAIKELGLPVAILAVITWWLAIRVEERFAKIEDDIRLHQRYLQQICVNTAPDSERRYQCWNIK